MPRRGAADAAAVDGDCDGDCDAPEGVEAEVGACAAFVVVVVVVAGAAAAVEAVAAAVGVGRAGVLAATAGEDAACDFADGGRAKGALELVAPAPAFC